MTRGASGWPGTGTSCWLAEVLPVENSFLEELSGESESESESSSMSESDILRLAALSGEGGAFWAAATAAAGVGTETIVKGSTEHWDGGLKRDYKGG